MVGITKDYSGNLLVGTDEKENMKRYKLIHIIHVINKTSTFNIIIIRHLSTRTSIEYLGANIHIIPKASEKKRIEIGMGIKTYLQNGENEISGENTIQYSWNII